MQEGYERWAPTYPPHPHNPVMQAEAAVVESIVRAAAGRRALDVGTGTGRNLAVLKATGAVFVTGIDLSAPMLSAGTDACPRVRGDAQRLPFASGSFDLVTSSLMCGDVPDLAAWIAEATRVLAPGGQLVYSDFHPSWAAVGWRRTFKGADGHLYELPFFPHGIDEHLELLAQHGMTLRAVREPAIVGKTAPVVVVLHAAKPRSRSR